MDRYWLAGAVVGAPSAADNTSHGHPTDGDPGGSIPATEPGAWMFHMLVEEVVGAEEAAGLMPDKTNVGQLAAAIAILGSASAVAAGRIFPTNDHISYGAAVRTQTLFQIAGAFAPADGNIYVAGFGFVPSLTGTPGDDLYGQYIAPTLLEAGSGVHALLAGTYFATPTVTAGAATVTMGATVYIQGACAPAGATSYALYVAAGAVNLVGAVTHGSTTTCADDIIFSADKVIRRNTSDASDNGVIQLAGGGAADITRGGYIEVFGNEQGASGSIRVRMGNVSGAHTILYRADGTNSFDMLGTDGSITFTSSRTFASGSAWIFNGTATNGGAIAIQKSGTRILEFGAGADIGFGSGSDIVLNAPQSGATLYLEAGNAGHLKSATIANDTTGSAANLFVNSSTGALQRSTSSKRYKSDIQPLDAGLAEILKLKPVSYVGKNDPKGSAGKWRHFGFIAEDMDDVMPNLVAYGKVGGKWVPDHIEYQYLTAPIVNAIQELHARVVALEGRKN